MQTPFSAAAVYLTFDTHHFKINNVFCVLSRGAHQRLKTGMGYLDYPSEYVRAQLSINHVTLLNTPIEAMYQVMGMLISRK